MKKNIMRIVMLVLAAAMLLSCTACSGSGSSSDSKDRLAQIKEKGYIELCTEPYFAPFEYVDPNKSGDEQYQGMDIEIAKYIADKIGVELKITALDYTAVLRTANMTLLSPPLPMRPPGPRPCACPMSTTPTTPAMASSSAARTRRNTTVWSPCRMRW